MDVAQLNGVARHLRGIVNRQLAAAGSKGIGHRQALDLVAAIAGLKSWDVVVAMPAQVAQAELGLESASRMRPVKAS